MIKILTESEECILMLLFNFQNFEQAIFNLLFTAFNDMLSANYFKSPIQDKHLILSEWKSLWLRGFPSKFSLLVLTQNEAEFANSDFICKMNFCPPTALSVPL